jgi:hypothetical protein
VWESSLSSRRSKDAAAHPAPPTNSLREQARAFIIRKLRHANGVTEDPLAGDGHRPLATEHKGAILDAKGGKLAFDFLFVRLSECKLVEAASPARHLCQLDCDHPGIERCCGPERMDGWHSDHGTALTDVQRATYERQRVRNSLQGESQAELRPPSEVQHSINDPTLQRVHTKPLGFMQRWKRAGQRPIEHIAVIERRLRELKGEAHVNHLVHFASMLRLSHSNAILFVRLVSGNRSPVYFPLYERRYCFPP